MTSVTDPLPATETRSGLRTALVVAMVGSAMAGLIHVAAVRAHTGDRTLAWMFGACAAAQLVWAATAAVRPSRRVLVAGAVINGGALLVWAASRTVGIPFVGSLADAELVGTQDLGAAIFAAGATLGAIWVLVRPVARVVIAPAWVAALAAFALLAALPSLTADHTGHGSDDHLETAGSHEGHSGDEGETAAASSHEDGGHKENGTATAGKGEDHGTHTTGTTGGDSHGGGHRNSADADLVGHNKGTDTSGGHHGTTDTTGSHHGTTDTTGGHHTTPTTGGTVDPPTGPIISLDDPRVTASQRAIAVKLISDARTALSAYPNVAAVEAAGYVSIGDGGTHGFEHYVKWSYLTDGIELNPTRIESIVVKKNGTAPKEIVSAMYILNLGKTMTNTPALAGELTSWHLHDNLCFSGTSLVAIARGGTCPPGSVLTITPPMLHVWMIPRPCGPFAGLEEAGETCATHEH